MYHCYRHASYKEIYNALPVTLEIKVASTFGFGVPVGDLQHSSCIVAPTYQCRSALTKERITMPMAFAAVGIGVLNVVV